MKELGTLEASVMQRLWDWGRDVTVREVLDDLQRERDIAYTTVMTVLDNLHRKGLVSRAKVGRAFRYAARESREAHTADLLSDVLAGASNRGAALLHFVDRLDEHDLVQLRTLLDKLESAAP